MLFWFDYLTADVLGVSMCIDRVQNKPTTLFQILLTLFKLWMKISWSLKVFFISVQALYSYPNPTLEDLLSLSLFFLFFLLSAIRHSQGYRRTPRIWAARSIQQLENSPRPLTHRACASLNKCMARAAVTDEPGDDIWYPGRHVDKFYIYENAEMCTKIHGMHAARWKWDLIVVGSVRFHWPWRM